MNSRDATLAAIAAKSEKESAYHVRHCSEWIIRLGDGTGESHRRAQTAVDDLWAYTGEMFEADDSERGLIDAGIAVDPAALRPRWLETVSNVLREATLKRPTDVPYSWHGKRGEHTEHLGYLLAEMQFLHRAYPGASW